MIFLVKTSKALEIHLYIETKLLQQLYILDTSTIILNWLSFNGCTNNIIFASTSFTITNKLLQCTDCGKLHLLYLVLTAMPYSECSSFSNLSFFIVNFKLLNWCWSSRVIFIYINNSLFSHFQFADVTFCLFW